MSFAMLKRSNSSELDCNYKKNIMSSKAEKTSQDLHQQHRASIFFRNPTLLKIVTWLGSLSFIGVTGVVWADLKPLSAIDTQQVRASLQVKPAPKSAILQGRGFANASAEREIFGPPLPTAQRPAPAPIRADRLPNREVPIAVSPASAEISPTGKIVRPQHADLLTADNFTVGVNGASTAGAPTEEFIEIVVPAPLSRIIPNRNAEIVTATTSQIRPNPIVKQSIPATSLNSQSRNVPAPITRTVPQVSTLPKLSSIPVRYGRTASSNPTSAPSERPGLKPTVVAPIKPAPIAPIQSIDNRPTIATAPVSVTIDVPAPLSRTLPVPTVARLPKIDRGAVVPKVPAIPTVRPTSANLQSKPLAFVSTPATNEFNASFIYPLSNPAPITSKFGWRTHPITGSRRFHAGIDIGAPMGAPVVATGSGTIVSAGWNGGYGKAIVIQHNGVQQTLYGHLSEIFVQPGQQIEQGTVIGRVGSTGNSTGPHLHFETRTATADGWVAVDPYAEVEYALDNLRRSMPFAQRDSEPGFN
jgi:murein DD-endopeptidase MepM/ murein hydrolase activator NlpD